MTKGNRIGAVAVVLSCALVAPAVTAAPIAPGNGQQTIDIAGTRMTVFTYRPPNCSDPSLLLVFHGVARNARAYREYARPLADRNCLLLVAPLFDERDFPGWRYQRGGIVKGGAVQPPSDWSGNLVPALADWVRQQEGRPLAYSLLGHSAGGQFLERLAAFVPTQARRIVVANPGSYVLPSVEVAAPYGLGKVYAGAEGEAQLRRYLELPLTIYVGGADTRLKRALAANGSSLKDAVKMTVYVTDMRHRLDWAKCSGEAFAGATVPAQTLLGISQLAFPEMMVEIDVTAVSHE